ncbi:alpha/beta hydrolase [Portibacter marinus]|uniref:alpha/beta hydrolase n=1 Tax=Portibacter marinus TaxID=2898660 RepID=UPI001EEA91BC|nr:alpha/beta hydrolase-fold protein [Portibacter marinus]
MTSNTNIIRKVNKKAHRLLFMFAVISFNTVFTQSSTSHNSISAAKNSNLELPNIQVIPITDSNTNRKYELYIKVPEEYSDSTKTKYPVLYFTDALWHIEILSGSTEYLLDNLILVGISWQKGENPGISRYRDFTLLKNINPKYQSGDAENHLKFIQNDVFKYVEENYRTQPENRSYFGYSLGGTFGTYILLTQPKTFNNYILGSPETLLDDSFIHQHYSSSNDILKYKNANVFISTGELERSDLMEQSKGIRTMLKSYDNL